jgi:hypothetical protein
MTKIVSKVPEGYKGLYVLDNEAYYNLYVEPKWETLPDTKHEILREVDGSKVALGKVLETPFGEGMLESISTGAKTCMNILSLRNEHIYVDLLECGPNAVDKAIDLANGENITLVALAVVGSLPNEISYNGTHLKNKVYIAGGEIRAGSF